MENILPLKATIFAFAETFLSERKLNEGHLEQSFNFDVWFPTSIYRFMQAFAGQEGHWE